MILTKRHYLMMGVAILLAAALTVPAATMWAASDPVMVPEHTAIHVTLDQAVATNRSKPGDHFEATVSQPVVVDGNGQNYNVRTLSKPRIGRDHKKRNWEWIGGSAAGGAVIGALAGGGTGALIGGPVGAGAGATVALVTGKKDIKLRAETPLKFELAQPVTIHVKG